VGDGLGGGRTGAPQVVIGATSRVTGGGRDGRLETAAGVVAGVCLPLRAFAVGDPVDPAGRAAVWADEAPHVVVVVGQGLSETPSGGQVTVYVAFVVDTFSRRIVGWSAATSKATPLVLGALEMGLWQRDREGHERAGLIHHSDAGSQYTSFRLAAHLAGENIAASIGTVGDALDNSLMESTIGLYKTELIKRRGPWRTLTDVELGTAEWIDWYNNRRLHGEIGHVPPVEYETEFYLNQPSLQLEAQP
jgi:putative transposase